MKYLKILVVLTFSVLTGMSVAQAFTDNPNTPPTCPTSIPGCNEPINVSATAQVKDGSLGLGGNLAVSGSTYVGTSPIYFGSPQNSYYIQNVGWNTGMAYNHNSAHLFRVGGTDRLTVNWNGISVHGNISSDSAQPVSGSFACWSGTGSGRLGTCATQPSGGGGAVNSVTGASGISVSPTTGNVVVTNTDPNRFGGMYTTNSWLGCTAGNEMNGGNCSCWSGFQASRILYDPGVWLRTPEISTYYCYKP